MPETDKAGREQDWKNWKDITEPKERVDPDEVKLCGTCRHFLRPSERKISNPLGLHKLGCYCSLWQREQSKDGSCTRWESTRK